MAALQRKNKKALRWYAEGFSLSNNLNRSVLGSLSKGPII